MSLAILEISDGTPEGTIPLINGLSGFDLLDWRSAVAESKEGGVYQDSAFADGRSLIYYALANVEESMTFDVHECDQDSLALRLRELRALLDKARKYWTTKWQNVPVYIKARGSDESTPRYAIIVNWKASQDGNPYAQPMYGGTSSIIGDWELTLERGQWQDVPPDTATCLGISAKQAYPSFLPGAESECDGESEVEYEVGASSDDVVFYSEPYADPFNLSAEEMNTGTLGLNVFGLIFRNVSIPVGSTLCYAKLKLRTISGAISADRYATIRGEAHTPIATFTTEADYETRNKTTVHNNFNASDAHSPDVWVEVDVTDVVRAIVEREQSTEHGYWEDGDDIALYVHWYYVPVSWETYASYDYGVNPPTLVIKHTNVVPLEYGRDETCLDEVFHANHNVLANLTDWYRFDKSLNAWSDNLMSGVESLPISIFPSGQEDGDRFYIGINSALANACPFSSIVMDIGTPMSTGSIDLAYYNGSTWVALTTNGTGIIATTPGVKSVHWQVPSNWATIDLSVLGGTNVPSVTGYWIRAEINASGAVATGPTQANRLPYTVAWNFIDIPEDNVVGDIPALARIMLRNVSYGSGSNSMFTDWVLLGLRSYDRGPDFNAYLNLGNTNNPSGIVVFAGSGGAIANDLASPSGKRLRYTPTLTTESYVNFGEVQIGGSILNDYYGRFRLFLRCKQNGGAVGDLGVRVSISKVRNRFSFITNEVFTTYIDSLMVLDFGTIKLPPDDLILATESVTSLSLSLYGSNINAAKPTLDCYDIVLIPVDEWSGTFYYKQGVTNGSAIDAFTYGHYMDIDSTRGQKTHVRSFFRQNSDNKIVLPGNIRICSQPFMLQANAHQRVWSLSQSTKYGTSSLQRYPTHEITHSVRMESVNRFYSYIGAQP